MEFDLEKARQDMEILIRNSKLEINPEFNQVIGIRISKKHLKLIGKGTHNLVFKLNGGGIGKIFPYEEKEDYYVTAGNLCGSASGGRLEETLNCLRAMNIENNRVHIADLNEFSIKPHLYDDKKINFIVLPDISEQGFWNVGSAHNLNFGNIPRGYETGRAYLEACRKILIACKRQYKLTPTGHGTIEDPSPAVTHMFLYKSNNEDSRVIIADLDHLGIKSRK